MLRPSSASRSNQKFMRHVIGHEGVLYDDILAARTLQPEHMPGVVDDVVRTWDQERANVGEFARPGRHAAAKHRPLAVIRSRRPGPAAADAEPAIDALHLAERRVGGRDARWRYRRPRSSQRRADRDSASSQLWTAIRQGHQALDGQPLASAMATLKTA